MFSLLSRRRIVKSLIQLIRNKYTDKKSVSFAWVISKYSVLLSLKSYIYKEHDILSLL